MRFVGKKDLSTNIFIIFVYFVESPCRDGVVVDVYKRIERRPSVMEVSPYTLGL